MDPVGQILGKKKRQITQGEWNKIFLRAYNSGKFQYSEDIISWMNKKFEVKK